MGMAVGAPVAALVGCATEPPTPACGDLAALPTLDRLGGADGALLVSEATGRPGTFPMTAGFANQLGAWFDHWHGLDARGDQLWLWPPAPTDDGTCTWRAAGRGVQLTRLRAGRELLLDLRAPARLPPEQQTVYWRLVASLNRFFAAVDATAGGIAVDDRWPLRPPRDARGADGTATGPYTVFDQDNTRQVSSVQGALTTLFDAPVDRTGQWDRATRRAVTAVLDTLGLAPRLAQRDAWQGFWAAAEQPR